jgi:hypothetical protein
LVPTIYDEVSQIEDVTSYPFRQRKSEMPIYKDYSSDYFNIQKIFLKKNLICYDRAWYSELMFWLQDDFCDSDDNFEFRKIELSRSYHEKQNAPRNANVLFSLVLGMDSDKKVNIITTEKILDFLGNLGGFQ